MSRRHGVRQRSGRAWVKLVVGLVVIAGVGGAGYALLADSTVAGGAPSTAEIARTNVMDFDITVIATGDLRAKNQVEIRSQLESQSTIAEIIDEGSTVKEGDLLVRLNSEEFEAEVEEELLRVESAKSDLVAAENDYEIQVSENQSRLRKANLEVRLAQLALDQYQFGDVEKTITDLNQKIDKANRELDLLKKEHEQNIELEKRGFISSKELEQGLIELEEARASVKISDLNLSIFKDYQHPRDLEQKQSDVAEAKAELDRVERENEIQLVSKDASRINAKRQLAIREQRLAKEERQVAACTIKAPKSGLVVYGTSTRNSWRDDETPLQIGRNIYPNELLIILPDTSEMIAEVSVPESVAGRVQAGQPARVKVDALGGETFQGSVVSKGVLAESGGFRDPNTREYTVRIAIDTSNSGNRLKPSMRCESEILLGRVDDTLAVPIQAVFREGPVQYVLTPKNGKYTRTPVKVGRRSDTYAEVTVGLSNGDPVLVRTPRPSELLQEPWNEQALAAVGVEIGEDGQPRAIHAEGDMMPAGFGERLEDASERTPDRNGPGGRPGGTRGRPGDGAARSPAEPAKDADTAKTADAGTNVADAEGHGGKDAEAEGAQNDVAEIDDAAQTTGEAPAGTDE
jgi:HlyD family secretion protein